MRKAQQETRRPTQLYIRRMHIGMGIHSNTPLVRVSFCHLHLHPHLPCTRPARLGHLIHSPGPIQSLGRHIILMLAA